MSDAGGTTDREPAAGDDGADGDTGADTDPEGTAGADAADGPEDSAPDPVEVVEDGAGGREVVVPLELFKTVTVLSTLIAVVTFVFGFVLLDAATLQVSLLRGLVSAAVGVVGVDLAEGTLSALLAGAGLASMAFGAAVYVLGSRFRTRGMGKSQEDSDERSDNG